MNYSKGALLRYRAIDEILTNKYKKYPTLEEIQDDCNRILSSDFALETISKDLKNMRYPYPIGFDAPIKYCPINKGYHYTDPKYKFSGVSLRPQEQDAIEEALDIIRALGGSRISENFNHAVEKLLSATMESGHGTEGRLPVIQLMTPPVSRGFEHFDLFYKASKEKIPVSFIHFSYNRKNNNEPKYKHNIIHPFLIKEFENRWYVIGYSEKHGAIRTFGMDRITGPVLLRKKFIQTDREERKSFLNDVYGIYPIPNAVKEKITLHASAQATNYFEAYPVHESQVIQKRNYGDSIITYDLIPSFELARFILSQGSQVIVREPLWFNEFVKNMMHEKRK